MTSIHLDEYTVVLNDEDAKSYKFEALRHGKPWRNLVGDNLILALVNKIQEQEDEIEWLNNCIDQCRCNENNL